jgi:hypothetical protein
MRVTKRPPVRPSGGALEDVAAVRDPRIRGDSSCRTAPDSIRGCSGQRSSRILLRQSGSPSHCRRRSPGGQPRLDHLPGPHSCGIANAASSNAGRSVRAECRASPGRAEISDDGRPAAVGTRCWCRRRARRPSGAARPGPFKAFSTPSTPLQHACSKQSACDQDACSSLTASMSNVCWWVDEGVQVATCTLCARPPAGSRRSSDPTRHALCSQLARSQQAGSLPLACLRAPWRTPPGSEQPAFRQRTARCLARGPPTGIEHAGVDRHAEPSHRRDQR